MSVCTSPMVAAKKQVAAPIVVTKVSATGLPNQIERRASIRHWR